jgi:tetratricopeptide (TPR) repeat protein
MEMLRLQNLFKAEAASNDPAKRAEYHKQAVDAMRGSEGNKQNWAITLASVGTNVQNPLAEFGNSTDPFEQFLLANVLYNKKQFPDAAKYFLAAARSGKYPQAYRFVADIYYAQRRYDLAEQLLNELSRQPSNPDAQWAKYMGFKLAHLSWEQGGGKNPDLEKKWVAAGQDYLKAYPKGQYAYEPRFRLAELEQRNKQYVQAANDYQQVSGNSDFEFHGKFNAAECDYLALVEEVNAEAASKDNKNGNGKAPAAPVGNRDQLRNAAVDGLDATIKMEPNVERSNPAQRATLHDIRGRAIYMLASLLERESRINYDKIAVLLTNYEPQYPSMRERFNDVFEWRIQALDQLGRYNDLERDVRALVERTRGNTASVDFMKELGLDFWKASNQKKARNDQIGTMADARLTAITYNYFEDQVQAGRIPTKNLTGTLSILGKAYITLNDVPHAEAIFNQVIKADPGSPDANAGLARIAQAKNDMHNALELWQRVEQVAAESDDVWYEAIFSEAQIYAAQGNIPAACGKLRETRIKHPNLGTPEMKAQWDQLQKKICLQTASAS